MCGVTKLESLCAHILIHMCGVTKLESPVKLIVYCGIGGRYP